jgi:hypothetical protein
VKRETSPVIADMVFDQNGGTTTELERDLHGGTEGEQCREKKCKDKVKKQCNLPNTVEPLSLEMVSSPET